MFKFGKYKELLKAVIENRERIEKLEDENRRLREELMKLNEKPKYFGQ